MRESTRVGYEPACSIPVAESYGQPERGKVKTFLTNPDVVLQLASMVQSLVLGISTTLILPSPYISPLCVPHHSKSLVNHLLLELYTLCFLPLEKTLPMQSLDLTFRVVRHID